MAGATGSALVEGISPLGSVPVVAEAGAGLVAATIPAADGLPAHLEETLGTNKGAMEEPTAGSVEAVGKGRWRLFGKKKGEKKEKAPAQPMVKYWELYRYSDPVDWLLMTLGSVGAIANGVSLPVFFLFFGKMVNAFGSLQTDTDELVREVSKYASYFAYLAVVELVACWLQVSCWMTTGERQASRIRTLYLRAVLRQDVAYFDTETSTGEIVSRVSSDTILVQEAMSEKVGTYLQFMATFVGGFVVGFATLWQLSLVILAIVPVLAVAGGVYAVVLTGLVAKGQQAYSGAGGVAEQMISAVRTVYSFAGEDKARAQYSSALETTLRLGLGQGLAKGLGMGVTFGVLFCAWALQFWVGSLLVIHGTANGGQALTTMFAVILGGLGLGQASPYLRSFAQGKAAAHKIFALIRRVPPIDSSDTAGLQLESIRGDIALSHIDFTYPARPDVPIFRDFSISIPAGATVALVGSSGSGKSTIVGLLERYYDPQAGVVSIDGHDIRTLQLRWLRSQLGLVSQEPALFATSIRNNILYGKSDASQEEVEAAARAANAHTFIMTLPRGYDTQVGERGVQMSGGQKQRIAIARAVIKNPRILLLDEATSALDSESEKVVQEALDRLMVGRTTVVVAHRLSTIRNADSIAVLQSGQIVEQGRHEELLARGDSGAYASLIALQARRRALDDDRPPRLAGPQLSLQRSGLSLQRSGLALSASAVSDASEGALAKGAPGAEEAPVARPSYWRLLAMNKPEWKYGAAGALGAIGAGAVNPVFALLLISVIQSYYKTDEAELKRDVRTYSLAFVGVGVGSVLVYTCEHFFFGAMGEYLTRRVREDMFAAVLRQEVAWFDRDENSSGAITARLATDATVVRGLVGDRLSLVTQTLALIAISFAIGFALNWRLAFVILATYPLIVASSVCQQVMLKGFAIDASKNYEQSSQVASEAVSNMRTVAAFSAEDKVLALFNSHLAGPLQRAFKRGQIAGIGFGSGQFALFASFGLALWYAGQLVSQGHGEFGQVLKVFMVMIVSAFAIGEALGLAPEVAKGSSALQSVFGLLDRRPAIDAEDPKAKSLATVTGTIDLSHVTFRYPSRPDVTVFNDFSLHVPAGRTVALVGQSGSGKSTIVSLVERFYDPLEGVVRIDGHDIRTLHLRALRRQIGLVSQEPTLFATTIKANIAYGRDNATEAEIVEAARSANAHTFISSLPDGYNTQVGERGVQMSGGQKQRIAIARAVLKDPRILLLDEATSALDSESEKVVQEALDRLMVGRTTVVVAHRLSTIRNADQIAVLAEGKIVEIGSHDKLFAKGEGGAYWSLVNLQNKT